MRELTIVTENRVGALAEICEAMGNIGVNISSISAHGYKEMGIVRLVTNDETSAKHALEKLGMKVLVGDLMVVKVPDKPGELGKLARKLANSSLNIEGIYLLGRNNGHLEVAVKTEDSGKSSALLKK